jgi:hypothetical protein
MDRTVKIRHMAQVAVGIGASVLIGGCGNRNATIHVPFQSAAPVVQSSALPNGQDGNTVQTYWSKRAIHRRGAASRAERTSRVSTSQ